MFVQIYTRKWLTSRLAKHIAMPGNCAFQHLSKGIKMNLITIKIHTAIAAAKLGAGLAMTMCVLSFATAADFHGLQTVPHWNERGELAIEVTNWSKLPLSVEKLTASVPGANGQSCELVTDRRIEVGPTRSTTVVMANPNRALECVQKPAHLAGNDLRTLRFKPMHLNGAANAVTNAAAIATSPLIAHSATAAINIKAEVRHRDQLYEAASQWSLATAPQ